MQLWGTRADLGSQVGQFCAKFVEHCDESLRGGSIGCVDLAGRTEGFEHDVDGAVVQEDTASIGQKANLCSIVHGWSGFEGNSGQGFSERAETCRRLSSGAMEVSART